MKKYFLTAVGVAGILFANSPMLSYGEVNSPLLALGNRPSFYIDSPPTFIYVPELGYSVAVKSPYDFIYYDNYYYLYDNGFWYSASFYDGPWIGIFGERLPPLLRGHRVADIIRFRDIEYGKHDRQYWQSRDQHDRRSQRETHFNNRPGLLDGHGMRSNQSRNDNDDRNRGDGQRGGDMRGPGNIRDGGDSHSPGDWRGGGRGR